MDIKRRRSVLFIPCSKTRALEKAQTLDCDGILFDLEDAVDVNKKIEARQQLVTALKSHQYGNREKIVRINHLDTPWGFDDLKALQGLPVDGICIPKVESVESINEVLAVFDEPMPIWVNIETPLGVISVNQIAAHSQVDVLIMGTNDLASCMRLSTPPNDIAFQYAFSACIMAARAYGRDVLDGVYNAFKDTEGFIKACEHAKQIGFDGKSLIHPSHIAPANAIFSPSDDELSHAKGLIEAWKNRDQEQGIAIHNGQMVEALHVDNARRILQVAE